MTEFFTLFFHSSCMNFMSYYFSWSNAEPLGRIKYIVFEQNPNHSTDFRPRFHGHAFDVFFFIMSTVRPVFEPVAFRDAIPLPEVQIKWSCNYWYDHFSVSLDPIGTFAQPFIGISKRRRIEELVSRYSLYWNASRCFRLFRRGFSFSLPSHCGSSSPSLSPHYNFLFSPLVYCRSHPFSSRLHYFLSYGWIDAITGRTRLWIICPRLKEDFEALSNCISLNSAAYSNIGRFKPLYSCLCLR